MRDLLVELLLGHLLGPQLGFRYLVLRPEIGEGDDVVVDDGHDLLDDLLSGDGGRRGEEEARQGQSCDDLVHSSDL